MKLIIMSDNCQCEKKLFLFVIWTALYSNEILHYIQNTLHQHQISSARFVHWALGIYSKLKYSLHWNDFDLILWWNETHKMNRLFVSSKKIILINFPGPFTTDYADDSCTKDREEKKPEYYIVVVFTCVVIQCVG